MSVSHHQEDVGDVHIRDLEMTHKDQSRSKVKMHFYYLGEGEHNLLIGTLGLGATVMTIRAIFTFVTLK